MNISSKNARRFVRLGLLGCIIPLLIACGSGSPTNPSATSNKTSATGTSTSTPVITGTITEFPTVSGDPFAITFGPDGNLWFTESDFGGSNAQIGRMTPTGTVTAFPVTPNTEPVAITVGPDGNLWYTETITAANTSQIGRFTVGKP